MNNVNAAAIEKFLVTIQNDPTQAKKEKSVEGAWVFEEGKPQFVATLGYAEGQAVLKTELPLFAGGWGSSPDPIQYCLYGLAACFAVTFAGAATSKGVQLTKLEVTAQNWMDLRKQMGVGDENILDKVKLTVLAEGGSPEQLAEIVTLAEERCPGTECLTRVIPLEVELRR